MASLFAMLKIFFRSVSKKPIPASGQSPTRDSLANHSRMEVVLIVAVGLVILAIGCGLHIAQSRSITSLKAEISNLEVSAGVVKTAQKKNARLAHQLTQFESKLRTPTKFQSAFENLTRTIPRQSWIYDLRYDQRTISLKGHSTSIDDLVQSLRRSTMVEHVEIDAFRDQMAQNGEVPFSISLKLKKAFPASSDG